jgi:hypothetical protein
VHLITNYVTLCSRLITLTHIIWLGQRATDGCLGLNLIRPPKFSKEERVPDGGFGRRHEIDVVAVTRDGHATYKIQIIFRFERMATGVFLQ